MAVADDAENRADGLAPRTPWRAEDSEATAREKVGESTLESGRRIAERERVPGGGRYEPTVGEHLRLGQFLQGMEKASEQDLRVICAQLAKLALLVYPATIRGLAHEAAENLSGHAWGAERMESLAEDLIQAIKDAH